MSAPRPLDGFEVFEFEDGGMTHAVYTRGSGPGVLLMHELPGMVPECVSLATAIASRGFTVFMPLMFGEAGAPPATRSLALKVCISREFKCSRTANRVLSCSRGCSASQGCRFRA